MPLGKAIVLTCISTSPFVALISFSWIFPSLPTSSILNLKLTQLIPSCAENQGQLASMFCPSLHSQRSSWIVSLMSSLDLRFPLAAHVVKRPVGGRQSSDIIPPCPTGSQNSFHPFCSSSTMLINSKSLKLPNPSLPSLPAVEIIQQSSSSGLSSNFPSPPHAHVHPCTIQPCKLKSKQTIIPSYLHPHIAVANCLFSWDTPFGAHQWEELTQALHQPLVNTSLMAVRGALAPNTKSTYAADQLQFTQFCDKWNISEDHMPVSYSCLCAFTGKHKGLQQSNMIRLWMSGLHSWHVVNYAPWYGDDE